MKSIQQIFRYCGLLALLLVLSSCGSQPPQKVEETPLNSTPSPKNEHPMVSTSLPVEYQTPSYVIGSEQLKDQVDLTPSDIVIKVGASIHSTTGPLPLRDIIKRLAALKGMNISWASDVDQNALVDVDINADDGFDNALDHLLRQINYFHEIKGTTLFIKNKETRQFHIAMPFITQTYSTDTGGDVLGGTKETTTFKGKISLASTGSTAGTSVGGGKDNAKKAEFDIWQNIEANLKVILDILETSETTVTSKEREFGGTGQSNNPTPANYADNTTNTSANSKPTPKEETGKTIKTSRQTSKTGAYFTIDKPVGIITVTATRDLLAKVEDYLKSLQKQLYRQVNIEAKIIEVQLNNSSSYGIDWSKVLSSAGGTNQMQLSGNTVFGNGGQLWGQPSSTWGSNKFISSFTLTGANFSVLVNALKDMGDTKVLSNPKISVLNGQPAFISVGRNTAYISKVSSTQTTGSVSNTVTYTVDTSSVLSGVGLALTANIMDDNEVILNLVPVVSRLLNGEVTKELIGSTTNGAYVGLPTVDVREMSTTVRVKNGEMLVIGGLIDNTDQNDNNSVPLLGEIPVIKYLFGSESKTVTKKELIILLKPTII